MAKNRAAQTLGRRGGRANTPAQQTARLANAAKSHGRPADYLIDDDGAGSLTLHHRDGRLVTQLSTKAVLFVTRWLEQHKPGMALRIEGGVIHYTAKGD